MILPTTNSFRRTTASNRTTATTATKQQPQEQVIQVINPDVVEETLPKEDVTEPNDIEETEEVAQDTEPAQPLPATQQSKTKKSKIEVILRDTDQRTRGLKEDAITINWRDAMNTRYQLDFFHYVTPHPDMMNDMLECVGYLFPRPPMGKGESTDLYRVIYDKDYVSYYFYEKLKPFAEADQFEETIKLIKETYATQEEITKQANLRARAEKALGDSISKSNPIYEQVIGEIMQSLSKIPE